MGLICQYVNVCIFMCVFMCNNIFKASYTKMASLRAQLVKNPPAMQETLVRFLGGEESLEKG